MGFPGAAPQADSPPSADHAGQLTPTTPEGTTTAGPGRFTYRMTRPGVASVSADVVKNKPAAPARDTGATLAGTGPVPPVPKPEK